MQVVFDRQTQQQVLTGLWVLTGEKKEEDSFVSGLRVLEKYFVFRITVPMETHKPGREDTAINYILVYDL